MPNKPLELPIAIAKAFVRDARLSCREKSDLARRDCLLPDPRPPTIPFQGKGERPLKLHQAKQMLEEMNQDSQAKE